MEMIILVALLFVIPYVVSLGTCLFVKRYGPAIGLIDKPGFRKIHSHPIPTGGGLGICAGVVVPLLLLSLCALYLARGSNSPDLLSAAPSILAEHFHGFLTRLPKLWTLLGLALILAVLGTLDDRFSLPWKLRLGVEFLVAAVAVSAGWRATLFIDLPVLTWILSVIWIVMLVNSFNMLDNMDALSGGVSTICSLFLAVVAAAFAPNPESGEPQYFLAAFLVLLAGATCGFLHLNRPPAKMFMGDGGAYFIGFLLGVTTLSMTFVGESTPRNAIFVPFVILATPLYDTVSVVLIRLKHGASPFVGDKNHYSHRLVALGLSRGQAVATIYLTTAICATGAFFLYQVNFLTSIVVLGQTGLILLLVAILEFAARNKIREEEKAIERLEKKQETFPPSATGETEENESKESEGVTEG